MRHLNTMCDNETFKYNVRHLNTMCDNETFQIQCVTMRHLKYNVWQWDTFKYNVWQWDI